MKPPGLAAPRGVDPLLAHLREVSRAAEPEVFSSLCRKDLGEIGLTPEAVNLLETSCWIGDYADKAYHQGTRVAVTRILRTEGVPISRGKRPTPGLRPFVEGSSTILELLGIPFGSGDNARMVRVLRRVAAELELPDPRGELRRIARQRARSRETSRRLVAEAVLRVFARSR